MAMEIPTRLRHEVPADQSDLADGCTGTLEDRNLWRAYYANDHLESTEVRLLHEEGNNLSKILAKAFPDDTHDTWSLEDLQKAVQESRKAWEDKERLCNGKAQNLFHSLMRTFDMHSTLFQIIPSGNTYASLVTGAATVLVKASVNHSKMIEELSNALDSINNSIALCDIDILLIRSQLVQNAIAKLYIALFMFFADAIAWYKSSSTKKVLSSLHNNFSEKFRGAIDIIKQQAGAVRDAAQLGSRAEIRVVRLDVQEIREELQDARIGLSGELRKMAELIYRQHGENLKQHEITQRLLETAHQNPDVAARRPSSDLRLSSTQDLLALPEPVPMISTLSNCKIGSLIAEALESHIQRTPCEVYNRSFSETSSFNTRAAQVVNRWLATPSIQIMHLEWQTHSIDDSVDAKVARRIEKICENDKVPFVMHRLILPTRRARQFRGDGDDYLIALMLDLVLGIIALLPSDGEQPLANWDLLTTTTSSTAIDFETATTLLASALTVAPPNLHMVILGEFALRQSKTDSVEKFISVIRNNIESQNSNLKLMILSHGRIHGLISCLRINEISLVSGVSLSRSKTLIVRRMPMAS